MKITRVSRSSGFGMTLLEMEGQEFDLELRLLSKNGQRFRRAVILSFFRQVRPWFEQLTRTSIGHTSEPAIRSERARKRGVFLPKGAKLGSPAGSVGFEIRMARTKLGWTQTELARRVGIRRSHLSDIERGLFLPRAKTRTALERALKEEELRIPPQFGDLSQYSLDVQETVRNAQLLEKLLRPK